MSGLQELRKMGSHPTDGQQKARASYVNLNYCQVCGKWLGMDDYDGICIECDVEEEEIIYGPIPPPHAE